MVIFVPFLTKYLTNLRLGPWRISWQVPIATIKYDVQILQKKCIVVNNFQPLQNIIKHMTGSKENRKFSFLEAYNVH